MDTVKPNIDFEEDNKYSLDFEIDSIYQGRNYFLFGILAGVRDQAIEPISEPKGLPNDVSEYIKELADFWKFDGHTYSWLSLKELLDYEWTQTTECGGYVNVKEYDYWFTWYKNKNKGPTSYCESINSIKIISEDKMKKIIRKIGYDYRNLSSTLPWRAYLIDNAPINYCYITWTRKYYQEHDFFNNIIPEILSLSEKNDYEDVRCVFWFDN